ncbi:hypothetical protein IAU60_004866 [Kwoniella sp. DSM 27419]
MSFLPNAMATGVVYQVPPTQQAPTAQTSGFAQAADAPRSQQVGITANFARAGFAPSSGGGLQSSPLVPKPGTSINPETGKPHTAGLTRAELAAKRAAEAQAQAQVPTSPEPDLSGLSDEEAAQFKTKAADLLDPTPLTQQVRRGSHSAVPGSPKAVGPDGRRLSDLSGREQAARQLSATATPVTGAQGGASSGSGVGISHGLVPPSIIRTSTGEITPGLELPGAWGPTKTVPVPGSAPNAPTSIYEDVAEGLDKVGRAAFAVIPTPIKEALSERSPRSPTSPRLSFSGTQTSPKLGTSPTASDGRRSSVTAIFDQARLQASHVASQVTETLQSTQRRASASIGRSGETEFVKNLKGFVTETFATSGPTAASREFGLGVYPSGPGRGSALGVAPRFSLPSEEPAGAVPGEHTSGVGALPGPETEAGVAVLPEERAHPAPVFASENQAVRPGETAGTPATVSKQSDLGSANATGAQAARAYDELNPARNAGSSGVHAAEDVPSTGTATSRAVGLVGGSSANDHLSSTETATSGEVEPPTTTKPDSEIPVADTASSEVREPSSSWMMGAEKPSTEIAAPQSVEPSTTSSVPTASANAPYENHGASSGLSWAGLAPALPATYLGKGADKGATDVQATLGNARDLGTHPSSLSRDTEESAQPSTVGTATSSAMDSPSSSNLAPTETRHANDRTTSSASVTAIRHGHEGTVSQISPLAGHGVTVPEERELDTPGTASSSALDDQDDAVPSAGFSKLTSLTPGNEHEGLGHPSTRGVEGATREPGVYPAAEHDLPNGGAHGSSSPLEGTTTSGSTVLDKAEKMVKKDDHATGGVPARDESAATGMTGRAPTAVTAASTSVDKSEPSANGPTQVPVTQTEHTTSVPAIAPTAKADESQLTTPSKTPAASAVSATPTSHQNTTSNGSSTGHLRKPSAGSEKEKKKGGFLGKLKEKLKH